MFVLVSPEAGLPRAEVRDPQDLKQLHVEFRGVDDAPAGDAIEAAGLGTVQGGHAWLDISALRAAGSGGDRAGEFEAMIGYARSKGWVDAAGTRVRAHIVRTGPAAVGGGGE